MSSSTDILVTGATGNVGRCLVDMLIDEGHAPAVALRTPERAAALFPDAARPVQFDFLDPSSFGPALEGIRAVFLVRPPALSDIDNDIAPSLRAMKDAGIERVIFLSLQGAEKNRFVPHHAIERHVVDLGLPHTFLRPSFFMQNLTTTHREEIRLRDEIFVPAGRGRTNFIDVRDIAEVAARTLREDGHLGNGYELTGSESLDYYSIAAMLSDELGRRITYRAPSAFDFFLATRRRNRSNGYALVVTALYSVARFGMAAGTTGTVAELLGRPPIAMRQFIHENRSAWLRDRRTA